MRILLTGGTGLIGRQLCTALLAQGHELTVLSRHPETVASKCGENVRAMTSLDEWTPERTFDAVINLAGEPIVDAYWSAKRKQVLLDSRVALTKKLVQRIASAHQKPTVLLSGSAVGYYGNAGDAALDESMEAGHDFPAELCAAWEGAARAAEQNGVRVCLLRTGLVLSKRGGLLGRMLLPFKLVLGARLGDGKQWMSWVHIDDYVAMVLRLLNDASLKGAFNMTAPASVTNAEFTQTLAQTLHRPALFVAPSFVLKLAMGERACLLLEGQRVLPKRLESSGFQFAHPRLDGALQDLLQ
ncbi:MAG: TIGR01777 family protein [Sideroxydans sp.]|nr:TIGR01777 family protein [Sideroxydans sp.]